MKGFNFAHGCICFWIVVSVVSVSVTDIPKSAVGRNPAQAQVNVKLTQNTIDMNIPL